MDEVFGKMRNEAMKRELRKAEHRRISEMSAEEKAQLDKALESIRSLAGRDDDFYSAILADAIMDAAIGLSVLHDDLPSHVLLRMAMGLRAAEAESAAEIVMDKMRRILGGGDE